MKRPANRIAATLFAAVALAFLALLLTGCTQHPATEVATVAVEVAFCMVIVAWLLGFVIEEVKTWWRK